ncbi:MAG: T9SS type A sorting domain-containing protein [Candidatus Neomarinimicrobiota bacterium]
MKRIVSTLIVLGILMTGTIFSDNLITNPGFETQTPAFWSPLNGTMGVDVDWVQAPNPVYAGFYSFMVSKAATSAPVGWISDNNADLYWNNASAGTYAVSAYIKTVGVNTSPANDDARIGLSFVFLDASDAVLNTTNVWTDQSTADVDWVQVPGVAILATEPASVVVSAFMGKDATGAVYFDNIACGTDPWSMGLFNGNGETVDGWLNWYASDNDTYGTVTSNEANTGTYAAELYKPPGSTSTSEIVYYSVPVPVEAGEWYKVGFWVKTEGVNTGDAFEPSYIRKERLDDRLGITYFFHSGDIATEWSLDGGDKFVYVDQREAATGWTHYQVAEQAPADNPATGISVRARFTSNPTGTAYFDDFSVYKMVLADPALGVDDAGEVTQLPTGFELAQNYPNPFNPTTTIHFELPHTDWIVLTVYNLLGQKIATLADGIHEQGRYKVIWNGLDGMQQQVPSGVYIYSLRSGETQINKKMILLR